MNTQSSMFQNKQRILNVKVHTVFILINNDSACQTTSILHIFKFKKKKMPTQQ